MKTTPPLADWILKRALPLGKRGESILGDLREEFRSHPSRSWYWGQTLRLAFRYLVSETPQQALMYPRSASMWNDLRGDLRTAFRMLRRNPGTSSLIVATLALAIGAATIGFAFADLALFRGLPVDDPSKVVSVLMSDVRGSESRGRVSAADFLDYRQRSTMLERISVFRDTNAALIQNGRSRTVHVSYASDDFFAAMGQPAIAGRTLRTGDDAAGAAPVAMLAHRYWLQEYGGRSDALGKPLQIGRDNFTIVGVLTPEMEFGNLAEIDIWLPMQIRPEAARSVRNLRFVARLRDGVSFSSAAAEIATIAETLEVEHPETNAGWKVRLVPIRDLTGGDGFWVVVAMFLLSIALLMAIATANVSNLIMVRTAGRQRELAVRIALGARRGRLTRQLVTEGMVLSLLAAALSLPMAWLGLQTIALFSPEMIFQQLTIDGHELGFVATLALICPFMFTFAASRLMARPDMRQVLASTGGRGTTASTRGRSALVVAQMAFAVILLTASTLALRSTVLMYASPSGMDTSRLLVFGLNFNDALYPTLEDAQAALRATSDALRAMPGAAVVSAMSALPILSGETYTPVQLPENNGSDVRPMAVVNQSTPDFAAALGLSMLEGASWREGDTGVAVIARETAMRLFGTPSALDRQFGVTIGTTVMQVRVVGVVSDIVGNNRTQAMPPRVWVPLEPSTRYVSFVVKSQGDPAALANEVRAITARTAPVVPVEYLDTLDNQLRDAASSDYVIIGILSGFSLLALLLASTGLFGVVSYTASQRTSEFGTRMALGASAWDVFRLVGRQAIAMLIVGMVVGLAGGIAVASMMGNVLFGVSPVDPLSLGAVVGLLTLVTLLAAAFPAWRASRIDPVIALRAE